MKLIHILALAILMVLAAAAQNTSQTAVHSPQARPSPTPSGAQKAGAKAAHAHPKPSHPAHETRKAAAGKAPVNKVRPAAASAKANGPKTAPKKVSAKPGSPAASHPPVVKSGVLPPQKKVNSHKSTMVASHSAAKGTRAGVAARKSPKPVVSLPAKTTAAAKAKAVKTPKPAVHAVKKSVAMTHVPEPKARIAPAGPSTLEKKPERRLIGSAGRRDPFVSPIRSAGSITPTPNCTSGKRCLAIPELTLQGTVRDITGKMMAVVSTSNRRTYTLRENDQVFNGSVEKITSDSIIFREYVKDALGRESAREVVKKMGPAS
jgi:Tfp pilus assembly protein PilP